MKKFELKTMQEISAEQQANLIAGSGSSCSCSCGSCSCSCSSESPSGSVDSATHDIQDSGRHDVSDSTQGRRK